MWVETLGFFPYGSGLDPTSQSTLFELHLSSVRCVLGKVPVREWDEGVGGVRTD